MPTREPANMPEHATQAVGSEARVRENATLDLLRQGGIVGFGPCSTTWRGPFVPTMFCYKDPDLTLPPKSKGSDFTKDLMKF